MSKFIILLVVASLVTFNSANNDFDDGSEDYEAFNLGKILTDLPKPGFFASRRQIKIPEDLAYQHGKRPKDESTNYVDKDAKDVDSHMDDGSPSKQNAQPTAILDEPLGPQIGLLMDIKTSKYYETTASPGSADSIDFSEPLRAHGGSPMPLFW